MCFSWGLSGHISWALRHLNSLLVCSAHVWVPPGAHRCRGPAGHVWHSARSSLGELRPASYTVRVRGCTACQGPDHGGLVTPASSASFILHALPGGRRLTVTSHPWVLGGFITHFPFELIYSQGSEHLPSGLLTSCLQSSPQTESRGCSVYWSLLNEGGVGVRGAGLQMATSSWLVIDISCVSTVHWENGKSSLYTLLLRVTGSNKVEGMRWNTPSCQNIWQRLGGLRPKHFKLANTNQS